MHSGKICSAHVRKVLKYFVDYLVVVGQSLRRDIPLSLAYEGLQSEEIRSSVKLFAYFIYQLLQRFCLQWMYSFLGLADLSNTCSQIFLFNCQWC